MARRTRIPFLVIAVVVTFAIFPQAKILASGADRPVSAAGASVEPAKRVPTVEDLMALKSAGNPQISPDGRRVAYTVTETDFDQDAYVTQIWLADVASGETIQLTRGKKSSSGPTWSPDGRWIAFTSSRAEDKSQIFVISPDGGEAIQMTKAETGVGGFDWSPDGKTIAYTASDPVPAEAKARKDFYGDYDVVRR
ncbi:MAG: TolB family protein, partial [Candidatus Aminicenantales bacterium]